MKQIATIGLDIAKAYFQVHGITEEGEVVVHKKLRRSQMQTFFAQLAPCLIGIEACATSHYWARELQASGHDVRLIPPSYVKPYVRRGKNDANDAAAICEAVQRPSMRFVPVKSEEQQSALMLHKARDLLVEERTRLINAIRAHLAELGIISILGHKGVRELVALIECEEDESVPRLARLALNPLVAQMKGCEEQIQALEVEIKAWHAESAESRLLATVPGIGYLTASLMAAKIGDARQFKSARELAAWLGLVPRQNSSGGKQRLGRISKQGDREIRRNLVIGATSVLRRAKDKAVGEEDWLVGLLSRRPPRVATVALANKMARISWAVLTRRMPYHAPVCTVAA